MTIVLRCRLLFLFAMVFTTMARADVKSDFENANKLYEQGKFTEAATAYEKLAQSGEVSPAIYFNLGNAFFKAGQSGRAIYYYRMAERLAPRDPDVQGNLQFARTHIYGGRPPETAAWRRALGKLSLDEWAKLDLVMLWLWFALLGAGLFREQLKKALGGITTIAGVITVGIAICLGLAAREQFKTEIAIVVAKESTVRYGPLEESQTAFTVRDGMELTVLDRKDNWLQVASVSQQIGWIQENKVLLFGRRRR